MHGCRWLFALAQAFTLALGSAVAAPVVIDFESVPANAHGSGAGQPPVTTQYADLGVSINSPLVFRYPGIQGFPHSGAQAVEHCYGAEFCTTPFDVSFRTPVARVRVWVGASSSFSNPVPLLMEALATDGSSRGTSRLTIPVARGAPPMQSLEVRSGAADIARVRIRPENDALMNGVALDDLEFEGLPERPDLAVPRVTAEPYENQAVRVIVEVANVGPAAAAATEAVVRVDAWSSPAQSVDALAPGQSAQLTFRTAPLAPGQHVVLAIVDPAGSLVEAAEDNNEARQTFVVAPPPPPPPQAVLVPVPSLVGQPQTSAEQLILGSGLSVGLVEKRFRIALRGMVVEQTPAAGERVAPATPVSVSVSDPRATWAGILLVVLGSGLALARRVRSSKAAAATPQPSWELRPDPGNVALVDPPLITTPGLRLRLLLDHGTQQIEAERRNSP